jgi:hypothetical protein
VIASDPRRMRSVAVIVGRMLPGTSPECQRAIDNLSKAEYPAPVIGTCLGSGPSATV